MADPEGVDEALTGVFAFVLTIAAIVRAIAEPREGDARAVVAGEATRAALLGAAGAALAAAAASFAGVAPSPLEVLGPAPCPVDVTVGSLLPLEPGPPGPLPGPSPPSPTEPPLPAEPPLPVAPPLPDQLLSRLCSGLHPTTTDKTTAAVEADSARVVNPRAECDLQTCRWHRS